ncbi:hypothetical protein J2Y45_003161 [Dyadobacter sp. BE34]|uniref:GyrI-like small molecule binding domain-containing protein n=1 Tax=Dyadobacter fermentans TaxID=94254 RepID=A0ABU1QXT1_9BACT|nr:MULTISPECIES: hypothetical protein [Dyadobacter]MDR6805969.1 hypothetical protein [Dyadobacter fermentans]MDR7043709.1 hypothetical protein [Dyadobacter sp. BE242]MDR7198021.1 hypothetical protein [Dyadobacter sp. BE34]MDR7215983.1 hypothetical protein [Dyadobacter sp. BE31]MDR7264491.1 hypothetical protein [Dyadobacter sp. BE32]
MYIKQVKKKDGIRLFAGKTEITDPAIIRGFVRELPYFGVKDSTLKSNEKMVFYSADSASIENIYPSLKIKRSGDTLFFAARWDMELPEDYAKWVYPMFKYRSPLGDLWYDGKYRVKARLVGYGNYSTVILPVFNFKRVRTQKYMDQIYRSGNSAKILLNEFDKAYINMIPETDTVAIEEYSYILERR